MFVFEKNKINKPGLSILAAAPMEWCCKGCKVSTEISYVQYRYLACLRFALLCFLCTRAVTLRVAPVPLPHPLCHLAVHPCTQNQFISEYAGCEGGELPKSTPFFRCTATSAYCAHPPPVAPPLHLCHAHTCRLLQLYCKLDCGHSVSLLLTNKG